jgi:hypothetical protein
MSVKRTSLRAKARRETGTPEKTDAEIQAVLTEAIADCPYHPKPPRHAACPGKPLPKPSPYWTRSFHGFGAPNQNIP